MPLLRAAFFPDGSRLVHKYWNDFNHTVEIYDAISGELIDDLPGLLKKVKLSSFSPKNSLAKTGFRNKIVKIYSALLGNLTANLFQKQEDAIDAKLRQKEVMVQSFSPNSSLVASVRRYSQTINIFDLLSGKPLSKCTGHTGFVTSVDFAPDSMLVASGSIDNTVKIWNAVSGYLIAECIGHTHSVLSVAFSHDGSKLASGSADNTVKIWDTASSKLYADCIGHIGPIDKVTFSPDNSHIASGSVDNSVKIWNVPTGECQNTLFFCNEIIDVTFCKPPGATEHQLFVADSFANIYVYRLIPPRKS